MVPFFHFSFCIAALLFFFRNGRTILLFFISEFGFYFCCFNANLIEIATEYGLVAVSDKNLLRSRFFYSLQQSFPVSMITERKTCICILSSYCSAHLHPAAANAHSVRIKTFHPWRAFRTRRSDHNISQIIFFWCVIVYSLHISEWKSGFGQCFMCIPDSAMNV